jgi:hypothetical protein
MSPVNLSADVIHDPTLIVDTLGLGIMVITGVIVIAVIILIVYGILKGRT